jgi:hypothetical protein
MSHDELKVSMRRVWPRDLTPEQVETVNRREAV